jgi:hypothetical protein
MDEHIVHHERTQLHKGCHKEAVQECKHKSREKVMMISLSLLHLKHQSYLEHAFYVCMPTSSLYAFMSMCVRTHKTMWKMGQLLSFMKSLRIYTYISPAQPTWKGEVEGLIRQLKRSSPKVQLSHNKPTTIDVEKGQLYRNEQRKTVLHKNFSYLTQRA